MKTIAIIATMTLASAWAHAAQSSVQLVLNYHIANVLQEYVPAEGNEEINKANMPARDMGANVYIFIHNKSNKPVSVSGITWDGVDVKTRLKGPEYGVMWWRCAPNVVAPGSEAEITICLREALKKDTKFTVEMGDAGRAECIVRSTYVGARVNTLSFSSDMSSAYLYVEGARGALRRLYVDGKPARARAKMLGGKAVNDLAVIKYTPEKPFKQGQRYVFRAVFTKSECGASVRAFGDLARFGTYGMANPKTHTGAGLDSYISFGALDADTLVNYGKSGAKSVITVGLKKPEPYMIGNPNIFGYSPMDEVDVQDYYQASDRPMHLRVGSLAQSTVDWTNDCLSVDPSTPHFLTVDLTFAPQNYFVYAKVGDVVNPDCYTIVAGWPLTVFRDKMVLMKRASSPQPFFATYQSEWEEVVLENKSNADSDITGYVVDKSNTRGFSRAPSPEEIRIPMYYAIGAGARGLFAFMSSTEFAGVYIHGSLDMPEIWRAVTSTSRALRVVAPLVQISHPTDWCKSGNSSLWMKTLLCGENVALVVAVNEACKSENNSFVSSPVMNASFSFVDLPWLIASKVYKLGDGSLDKVVSTKQGKILNWREASISDGDVYLVCSDSKLADELVARYNSRPPQATPEGRQAAPEGPLKGRRKSSDAR